MKKILSLLAVGMMLAMPAHAWTYDGLGSLNPFTNFGRGFGGYGCGCEKPKLTKCEKLHGVKIRKGTPCGCAAPIEVMPVVEGNNCAIEPMPIIYENCPNCLQVQPCSKCRRAF